MIPTVNNVYDVLEMILDKDKGSLVAKRVRQEPWTWEEAQNFVKKQEHSKMFHVLPRYKWRLNKRPRIVIIPGLFVLLHL